MNQRGFVIPFPTVGVVLFAVAGVASAQIPGHRQTVLAIAVQTVQIPGDSPLNPFGIDLALPLTASGSMTFHFEDQVGSTNAFNINPAEFFAENLLGKGILRGIEITGQLENIQQVGPDTTALESLIFAEVTTQALFALEINELALTIPGVPTDSLTLVANDSVIFTGQVEGLPIRPGTVLTSPESVDVFLDLNGNSTFDPIDPMTGGPFEFVVGQSLDRTVTVVVPEPGVTTLVSLCIASFAVCGIRITRGSGVVFAHSRFSAA